MARPWLYAVGAVVTLGLVIGAFLGTDPLAPLGLRPPPIEALTVERTVLDDDGIGQRPSRRRRRGCARCRCRRRRTGGPPRPGAG